MKLDAASLPALLDDLDAALRELVTPFEHGLAGWDGGPTGHWNAGQHVEHVGRVLAMGAGALERAAEELRRDDLRRRPWRDPIQAWFVGLVTRRFPRGGRSPKQGIPAATPDREAAFALVAQGAVRHRVLVDRLTPAERERLWVWNPFAPRLRWHYTLSEIVRVQATHARHHARAASEAAGVPRAGVVSISAEPRSTVVHSTASETGR